MKNKLHSKINQKYQIDILSRTHDVDMKNNSFIYWVVRKVRADFEGKLKHRRFKFLISFIKFKSFAARTFRTTQYNIHHVARKI